MRKGVWLIRASRKLTQRWLPILENRYVGPIVIVNLAEPRRRRHYIGGVRGRIWIRGSAFGTSRSATVLLKTPKATAIAKTATITL